MSKSYILFCVGTAIGTFMYHGFTSDAYVQLLSAMIYAFTYGVILAINGTYTTT